MLCTFRYYDPAAGRWLTRDPIGYDGGMNLYAYCDGDPVNFADTSGLRPITIADRQVLGKLYTKNLDLVDAPLDKVNSSVRQIKAAILAVPAGQQDPASLRAVMWAISQLGNPRWDSSSGTVNLGNYTALKPGTDTIRCNYFVAAAYLEGAKVTGWPSFSRTSLRNMRVEHRPELANSLASQQSLSHLPLTSSPQVGDVISFSASGDSGHTTLNLGGGLLIYHGGTGIAKVGTFQENLQTHIGFSARRWR